MEPNHRSIEDIEALRTASRERALSDIASPDLVLRMEYLEREGFGKPSPDRKAIIRDWPEGALVHYAIPNHGDSAREFIGHVISPGEYLKETNETGALPAASAVRVLPAVDRVYLRLDRPVDPAAPMTRYTVIERTVAADNTAKILVAHRITDIADEIHRVRGHIVYMHERHQLEIAYQDALLKVLQKEMNGKGNSPAG